MGFVRWTKSSIGCGYIIFGFWPALGGKENEGFIYHLPACCFSLSHEHRKGKLSGKENKGNPLSLLLEEGYKDKRDPEVTGIQDFQTLLQALDVFC